MTTEVYGENGNWGYGDNGITQSNGESETLRGDLLVFPVTKNKFSLFVSVAPLLCMIPFPP
jgi:hypothetical protein